MSFKKPSWKTLRALCGEVQPEDGIDPREWVRQSGSRQKIKRKALQLCEQVAETIAEVLAADARDDVLRNLQVVEVVPAPDASRLLVTVLVDPPSREATPEVVLERLSHASGRLRSEVAQAITRRRAPVLAYSVLVKGEDGYVLD
ncbi:ribosome-binding factor A [Singulisphaera sp. PoT]|uniref:ribosome-binding factor A n=1 Tax=Singulisphaera sp. PoT TaxID=3411797 RepID=UPI003BF56F09